MKNQDPRAIKMKKRSLAGNVAVGTFVVTLVCIFVAFCAPAWLVSDPRITGANFDRLGLWSHCFRSLADPKDSYQKRFFVGCRWVYDPFTTGYDEIRGFLLPPFMMVTQVFFTLCFIFILIALILVLIFFLCFGPEQKYFVLLSLVISGLLMAAGVSGGIAVIVFASLGNTDGWMPGHANNFFGWAFGLGVAGVVMAFISGTMFLVESRIQRKKREYLKESQTRFDMEQESKA
ncbi:uncharacterized protein sinu isoform X2 [Periplaneta americana]|uniref:uncharacterized protein sinu isoform X2 n=1 Tax=Periplaneta americana TaxID=6978 RepID=UPI0037E785BD